MQALKNQLPDYTYIHTLRPIIRQKSNDATMSDHLVVHAFLPLPSPAGLPSPTKSGTKTVIIMLDRHSLSIILVLHVL